jgi:hypothetical protein
MADKILGMNNTQSWVEALNISPEMLAEWSSQAPAGKPLLVHCLEEGHLSVPEYMEWASDHYGLAVLSAGYFQEALDMGSLAKHRADGLWQPWCFPVEQWDGVTFVACVEPPEQMDAHVRYVLADPRAMKEVWGEPMTSVDALNMREEAPPPPPAPEVLDIPDGMKLNTTKPFVLNLDESQLLFNDHQDEAPLSAPEAPVAPSVPPPVFDENTPPPAPTLMFSENSEVSQVPIHPVEEPSSPSISVIRPVPQNSPVRPKSGALAGGGKLNLPVDEDAACASVFKTLNAKYNNTFIVKCTETEAQLYKWDSGLNPSDDALRTISLSQPTFFRIVAKTLLPYHGYLIDSPVHRQFFSNLGLEEIPPCITAVPLKLNGSLWGILVAMGGKELQNLETLQETESVCAQLIKTVGAIWGRAA